MNGIETILGELAHAQTALRDSSRAFDTAIAHLGGVLDGIRAANHAQGAAIEAVVRATEEALRLITTKGDPS